MLKKRLLPLALFLALVLCASCACADGFIYLQKQPHLLPSSSQLSTLSVKLSSISSQGRIRECAETFGNQVANHMRNAGIEFDVTYKSSWKTSDLFGVPLMTQRTEYRSSAGDGFALNTKALLFEANLVDENENPVNLNNVGVTEGYDKSYPDRIPIDINTADVAKKLNLTSTNKAMLSAAIVHFPNEEEQDPEDIPWDVPPFASDGFSVNDKGIMFPNRLLDTGNDWDNTPLTPATIYDYARESTPFFTNPADEPFLNYATIYVNHFSPYAFIWTEMELLPSQDVLSAIDSLPMTGDSSSLAPWLLLGGASLLLLLAKKKSAASA